MGFDSFSFRDNPYPKKRQTWRPQDCTSSVCHDQFDQASLNPSVSSYIYIFLKQLEGNSSNYMSWILFQPVQIYGLMPCLDLVLLFFMVNFSKNEATCRTEKTTWGSAVMNHTYKTLNASNFVSCVLKCDEESQCRSCNFWWNKLECELNYAATYSVVTSFIRKVNCVHRDMDWEPGTHNNLNSSTISPTWTPREKENGRAKHCGQEASRTQELPWLFLPCVYLQTLDAGTKRRTEYTMKHAVQLTNAFYAYL